MNDHNNRQLTGFAKTLRKNMTKEERHLWFDFLKQLPYTVNRQKVFGCYILDFYIAAANLAIELDGAQHYEERGALSDAERDASLRNRGITVLRYSNREINEEFSSVCEDILHHLMPSPRGKANEEDAFYSLPLEGKVSAKLTDEVYSRGAENTTSSDAVRRQLPLKGKPTRRARFPYRTQHLQNPIFGALRRRP